MGFFHVDEIPDARFSLRRTCGGCFGYPGYAEILGGVGVQTLAAPGERWQGYAQLMAGANVHGQAGKAAAGVRYALSDTLALNAGVGRVLARGATGGRFSADNLALGLDYRFAIPTR